jgi:hypothetical protein
MSWGFYGRSIEQEQLATILRRGRFSFVQVTGRRRIGKTTLVQRVLPPERPRFYVQLPDSAPPGILSAIHDAHELFALDDVRFPRPRTLHQAARFFGQLVRAGFVVAIDEFQFLARKQLAELPSALQAEVDLLLRDGPAAPGALIVLGSVHTEMAQLLEDRAAPLYNRTTDHIHVGHLDFAALKQLLTAHGGCSPSRLLFLWTLFEGVPKFYRDAFEQGVLDDAGSDRRRFLRRMFFDSSSPLRTEADNWFLKELRGRYDVVLKYVARHPGCTQADLVAHVKNLSPETDDQVGGYIKVLAERFAMIERRLPMLARREARLGRYYLTDNFLRAWLAALAQPVQAQAFRPVDNLVVEADTRLAEVEGYAFEKLVGALVQERGRRALGDIALTEHVRGFWDRAGIEIDFVGQNDDSRTLWLGSCRRSPERVMAAARALDGHAARLALGKPELGGYTLHKLAFAPTIDSATRSALTDLGHRPLDLEELLEGL